MTSAGIIAQRYRVAMRQGIDFYLNWNPFLCGPLFLWHAESATDGDLSLFPPARRYAINKWISELPPASAVNVLFTGQDAATLALWERNQTVLDIDPELFRELGDINPDQEIPAGLFQYLPYPDPFLAFPDPLILPLDDGQYQSIHGAYLTGRAREDVAGSGGLCSTHAPGITEWSVTLGGRVHNADGSVHKAFGLEEMDDYVWTRITLTDGGTLADMAHRSMVDFIPAAAVPDTDLPETVTRMFGAVLSTLVYICSANADMEAPRSAPPRKVGKRGRRVKAEPGMRMVKVGYRLGAALKAYRKAKAEGRSMPTGIKMPPHVRRSHFQNFAVGPGRPGERTGRRLRWVGPIEVNMKLFKGDTATVHRVPVKKGVKA